MEQDIAAQVVGLGGATDFTLWSLFMRADFVVKFVIILLIASSIFSWALIPNNFSFERVMCQCYLHRTALFDRFRLSSFHRVNEHGFSIYFWDYFEDHHQDNNFGEE